MKNNEKVFYSELAKEGSVLTHLAFMKVGDYYVVSDLGEVDKTSNLARLLSIGPWYIKKRGNPVPYGYARVASSGHRYGVKITFGVYNQDDWPVVDKFIRIFFESFNLVAEFILLSKDYYPFPTTQTDHKTDRSILPKSKTAMKRWRMAYEEIVGLRKKYEEDYNDGEAESPQPTINDIRDALIPIFTRKPSDRTVEKIIAAGDLGKLK